MMAVTIEQHTENKHYVSLEIENRYGNNIYKVQVCPQHSDGLYGYSLREMSYPIKDKKKAYATYRRYIRRYCEGK